MPCKRGSENQRTRAHARAQGLNHALFDTLAGCDSVPLQAAATTVPHTLRRRDFTHTHTSEPALSQTCILHVRALAPSRPCVSPPSFPARAQSRPSCLSMEAHSGVTAPCPKTAPKARDSVSLNCVCVCVSGWFGGCGGAVQDEWQKPAGRLADESIGPLAATAR